MTYVNKHEAAKCLGVSTETLKRYRQQGRLINDVHFTRLSSRLIVYNKELLEDWVANGADSNNRAHLIAISNFSASLLSYKPRRRAA